ncbi:nucleotidyltransferase domain-containing protein [Cereibacter sphaeroides]|uniref:nucleotidyltransferase family protein n=1 Tax=Cereibacter sphaeroides TaxID=1063 RepID=UPI001F3F3199|nr:nucleotidyltransferase domain-containing protein [Cereibacter sphaeroides]MCE6958724.1 nucleotidyltransferase domain-containing protein [Cereibacter sphaeroides]MCE6973402.1 nucleotidyltransferase domain-containing protein [Cereibacter sphaeroides]
MTIGIVTLAERKARAKAARVAASERIAAALRAYARVHGGRYVLFGSAARGEMRHDSDIDILVDFPPEREAEAMRHAEDLCAAEDQSCDVLPMLSRDPAFLQRISPEAVDLS